MDTVECEAVERSARDFNRLLAVLRRDGTIPERGLPEHCIREFLTRLAGMDSNNRYDTQIVGAGEREGRVWSPLVRQLHLGLSHGVGRSGSLTERQPKAVGSGLLAELANKLALDAVRVLGIRSTSGALVVPNATGMTLALCLSAWRSWKPNADNVVFLRVDQRSCLKSILTAGYQPIVIDSIGGGSDDGLGTDLDALGRLLDEKADSILAVLSVTSCFAPRRPDDLQHIGELCMRHGVRHLVNNAYGLQSAECRRRLEQAGTAGGVHAFVQSTDKNFMVPVGGAIVGVFDKQLLAPIANHYPGRASAVPARDLLITLLQLGRIGLQQLHADQVNNFGHLHARLSAYASQIGQRVLHVPQNSISLAMTLNGWTAAEQRAFGARLFARAVYGARVVPTPEDEDGLESVPCGEVRLRNFGAHSSRFHQGYLCVACALGMSKSEIDQLIKRLEAITPSSAYVNRSVEHESTPDT